MVVEVKRGNFNNVSDFARGRTIELQEFADRWGIPVRMREGMPAGETQRGKSRKRQIAEVDYEVRPEPTPDIHGYGHMQANEMGTPVVVGQLDVLDVHASDTPGVQVTRTVAAQLAGLVVPVVAEIIVKGEGKVQALHEERQRKKNRIITLPGPEVDITGTPGLIVKDPALAEAFLMAAARVFAKSDSEHQSGERIKATLILAQQKKAEDMLARLTDPSTREAAKREAIPYFRKASERYAEMKAKQAEPKQVFPNP